MNIRELELFKHLATTLHFGRTSIDCHITASGLTRTIQRLEIEVGEALFFRNNRTVSLTQAGIFFKEYCEETISRWAILQNRLKSDTTLRGELTLYCSVTAILSVLPQIFGRFRKTHPEVTIHIQTGDAAKALPKLQAREVDIAVAALPDHQPEGFEFITLLQTPLVFILSTSFPDIISSSYSTINWDTTPVILPSEGLSRLRGEKWFAEKGIRPRIYAQVSGNEAIIAMVSMGCGIGIVPLLVLQKSSLKSEVEVVELTPQLTPFTVGVCTLRKNKRNPVVEAFWEIVEKEMADSL
ncbi:MAG: HTH-type transcriptional activator IlvY [Proteobacteria bacterium]|nr:HTH-type transcriptional activator IlvY [Pseudomonadota bacterium]